jgi:DNA-directed RNA polymerase subunit RPC12/RpoP
MNGGISMAKEKKQCALCGKEIGGFFSTGASIKDGVVCMNCAVHSKLTPKQFAEFDTVSIKEYVNQITPDFKEKCALCGKEMGFFSTGPSIKDGVICANCKEFSKLKQKQFMEFDIVSLKEYISKIDPDFFARKALEAAFAPTKSIEKYFYVDDNRKQFRVGKNGSVYNFSDLLSFELLEDGVTITKGGLGRAVAGGILFGGGVTGKKAKEVCTLMSIVITVKNSAADALFINFIGGGMLPQEFEKNGIVYHNARKNAQLCLSALKIIADGNEAVEISAAAPADTATELQKFHELMKNGVITEDDFNAKKAQLLGL